MSLSFLKSVTVNDVTPDKAPRSGGGGVKKERNPKGMAIRLFKDGSVFPSQELVDAFSLEYAGKDVESGYGLDIFDSKQYHGLTLPEGSRVIWAGRVKKEEPKVDLFGSVNYHPEVVDEKPNPHAGNPVVSVLAQGSRTFGTNDLIPMVEEIYGIKFAKSGTKENPTPVEGVEFVDLVFMPGSDGKPLPASKTGVAYVPKKLSRGEKAGTATVVRREFLELYALVPSSMVESEPAEGEEDGPEGA